MRIEELEQLIADNRQLRDADHDLAGQPWGTAGRGQAVARLASGRWDQTIEELEAELRRVRVLCGLAEGAEGAGR